MNDEQELLRRLRQAVIDGSKERSVAEARAAIEAGIDPLTLLNEGLVDGADEIGASFQEGKIFLPELMLSGIALKAAMAIVTPLIKDRNLPGQRAVSGSVVIATIQTDVHDIGKNLVASMLSAVGFTVHDLGVDVPLNTIIGKASEVDADIIACSALLTTSMPYMRDLVGVLEATGLRERFKVMVGGASITPALAEEMRADGTAGDAIGAVALARKLLRERRG